MKQQSSSQSSAAKAPLPSISRPLLAWYRKAHRDLPWRDTTDPYAIWVSELMLQQTQVATVIPYYHRWLKRFPTVFSLARARIDSVLKQWQGLGYYRRARYLHQAARVIVRDHDGRVPDQLDTLTRLPGIGESTAGAILSIAYHKPHPVLDGNVIRVLTRLLAMEDDPADTAVKKQLWQIARRLISPTRPGHYNQAMMELGATCCVPTDPDCPRCPLRTRCLAARDDLTDRIPRRKKRQPTPHYNVAVAVIVHDDKVLIDRRPDDGLLGGLWEFPGGKQHSDETIEQCLHREMTEELGITVGIIKPLVTVPHAFSHFRITLHAFLCRYEKGRVTPTACTAYRWVRPDQLGNYSFPAATSRIITALDRFLSSDSDEFS